MIEARDILMMAQNHDPARIVGARLNDRAQPFDQFRRQRAVGLKEMLKDRRADGIVAGVERDDAPMVVLEAEIARPLAMRTAVDAELWQDVIEIAVAQRIHLMIAVERKRALRSQRPFAWRELVAGIGDAEEIGADLRRVSDVIDVAEMDRIVRPPRFDERGDLGRFVRAASPIARQRDADLAGVAAEAVDSVIPVLAIVGQEGMTPTDSKSPIFGQPPPKSVRREGGEGWIG